MTQEETLSLFNRPVRVDPERPGVVVNAHGEMVLVIDQWGEQFDDDEDAQAMAELLVDLINGATHD